MQDRRCQKILEGGRQCAGFALKSGEFCFSHDPHSQAAKSAATRKGGQVRIVKVSEPLEVVEIETPRDIIKLLAITVKELRAGKILPQIANTTGFLTAQLLRAFEAVETSEKLDAFNSILAVRNHGKAF